MSNEIKSKINRLISKWPKGTPAAASYLNKQGYNHALLTRYKKSEWLQSFGRGAYILSGDNVGWFGALYTLQNQLGLNIHPGGRTALELRGYAHYLPTSTRHIFLYGTHGLILPKWFNEDRLGVKFSLIRTNLFPAENLPGISVLNEKDISLKVSAPERAAMEMLYLVPGKIGFNEAFLIMENLATLRSGVVQQLLEKCRSIKVKRLFLFMSEKHGHKWISDLDISRFDLGKGKRVIVPNGQYNSKYQITVPRDNYEEVA